MMPKVVDYVRRRLARLATVDQITCED